MTTPHGGFVSSADAVQLEFAPCPLGCPPADKTVLAGRDLLHDLPGTFTVVQCEACGLKRTTPRPTPETMGIFYPAEYGPYRGTRIDDPPRAGRGLKSALVRAAKRILSTKAHALPPMRPGRMLEIGCASGSFMHQMAASGWDVEGVEFSEVAAREALARGYRVETGALETIEKEADAYDLIVGWMVVEHLHQPVQCLRKLAGWARRDAMLAISVPNAGSFEAYLFGTQWYALQLPTHLFHYDTATIRKLLHAAGWEVVAIHHQRTVANLVASLGYWLRGRGLVRLGKILIAFPETGGRLGALLTFPLAFALSLIGQTGRMTVWARRAC